MTTLTELKKLAEAATDWDTSTYHAFYEEANPAKLLEMIAVMEQMAEALKDIGNMPASQAWKMRDEADLALAAYERLNEE